MPAEVTIQGQFLSYVQTFIHNSKGAKHRDNILLGQTFQLEDTYIFKPEAFREFLKTKRFSKLTETQQMKMFQLMGGSTYKLKIEGKSEHCWSIPLTIETSIYNLKDRRFKEEDPY